MILIAHRGNTTGVHKEMENAPRYIQEALDAGFDVEIDVWAIENSFFLGHDEPQYPVDKSFLLNDSLWCHAKNKEALDALLSLGAHCFWHQEDDYTLTSRGHVWVYPEKEPTHKGIIVLREFQPEMIGKCMGICSDDVVKYKELIE